MKTKLLTAAICTVALFFVNLAYGHYPVSPYAYTSNNPVNRVDPDGRDDYRLNRETGDIEFYKKTKADTHTVYASKDNGNINRRNSYTVEKSMLNGKEARTDVKGQTSDGQVINVDRVDVYRSADNAQSTGFFEFVAGNSNVEWSHVRSASSDGTSISTITTSHLDGSDIGLSMVVSDIVTLNKDYAIAGVPLMNVVEANHSHNNGSTIVSYGDRNVAARVQSAFPAAQMHIYTPKNGYTPFNRYSTPGLLPGIVVRPR